MPIKLWLNGVSAQTNPYLMAEAKGQVLPSLIPETPSHYLNNYWNIDPINFTATSYSVRLTYPTSRVTGNSSYLIPYKYNSTVGLLRASNASAYTRTSNGNFQTLTWTGLTSFSSFGAGDGEVVLPVTFAGFTAKLWNGVARLNWSTYSELNNQGFSIERSADGLVYEKIAFVNGAGTTNAKQYYQYTDRLFIGSAYYRLVQTDFDGKTFTTQALHLTSEEGSFNVVLESNPSSLISLLGTNEKEWVSVSVVNYLGTPLYYEEGTFERVAQLLKEKSANYKAGMYVVNVSSTHTNHNLKAVKK